MAQEEKEKRLYAIERVTNGKYVRCRLHVSVSDDGILERGRRLAKEDERQLKRQALPTTESGGPRWSKATMEVPHKRNSSNVSLSLPSLLMERVMQAPQKVPEARIEPEQPQVQSPLPLEPDSQDQEHVDPTLPPEGMLQDLAKSYMETLYVERTSLAYFVKGPLLRARNGFTSATTDATPADLTEFLRQSILTSATIDQKYREGIANIIKDLPGASSQSPEDVAKRKSKRKKKWKAKRSKAGLFVYEDGFVERWWRSDENVCLTDTTDEALRRRVPKIRMRETFMQLMLILEVLALDNAHPLIKGTAPPAPALDDNQIDESQPGESQPKEKKQRPKKKQDLSGLLDTTLDKLCIWQSLESHSPAKSRAGDKLQTEDDSHDVLKSFCVEVVIPFYASRIPQQATLVNKKLGGPAATSPVSRKSTSARRPGEPAVRQAPEKRARQPLARVSTDTLNKSTKLPPTLQRSATDSGAFPRIKREGTDTPPLLDLIPTTTKSQQARRPRVDPLQRLASSTGRRVMDISAMSQASEAKLRKKAERAEMIKEAVEGIKKPKRALVEAQEKVDENFAKAMAKAPKPQQRARKAVAETGVAKIAATPFKDAPRRVGVTPHRGAAATTSYTGDDIPSSTSIVPSSSIHLRAHAPTVTFASPSRPRNDQNDDNNDLTFAIPQTGHRPRHFSALISQATTSSNLGVEETPSRGFARFMPRGLATDPGTGTLESPIARRKNAAIVQSPPIKAPFLFDVRGKDETPMKPLHVNGSGVIASPFAPPPAIDTTARNGSGNGVTGGSLYASLGWDDHDGYEELT